MSRKLAFNLSSGWLSLIIAAGLLVVAIFLIAFGRPEKSTLEVEETSEFSKIRIRRRGNVRSLLFVRDSGREALQSRVDLAHPHELLLPYSRAMFASYLYRPEQHRVLIVGLGGGGMVHFLRHHQPQLEIDVVEIDPVIVRLADEYFGVRPDENTNIFTADGVDYLRTTEESYDVIYMDAFLKPSADTDATGVPQRLKTVAFYRAVQAKLKPEGIVVFNLNSHPNRDEDIATIGDAFPHTQLFDCPGARNLIVVGTTSAGPPDGASLETRAAELDRRFQANFSFREILRTRRQ